MNKDLTIYDIAKVLSLSAATVSRALNNHAAVNNKTKERILKAANEAGYTLTISQSLDSTQKAKLLKTNSACRLLQNKKKG